MCGIAGIVSANISAPEREELVWRMLQTLTHRGPDAQGVVSKGFMTFGVARLSIVDRATAHQPMSLRHGNLKGLIAYNGEVYNFEPLRAELEAKGVSFQTHSDTETVLAGHLNVGTNIIEQLDGMFAYAIWLEPEERLLLVRDRFGIKPLFYAEFGDTLLFASEPKALFCYSQLQRRPDFTGVLEYFVHGVAFASGYVTGDRSFFQGIKSLPPAHFLTWTSASGLRQKKYWSPLQEIKATRHDEREAQVAVRNAITKSVRSMLMGEVPIGTALSGGIDSSLISLEAARAMSEPLVSACITYKSTANDQDAYHASLVSRKLNDETPGSHLLQYTYLREETYLDALDEMICAFDEPHWEPRQLAMFENYRTLARAGRTVVLTGEGADELFFGYYEKFPGFKTPMSAPAEFANLWRKRLPKVQSLLAPAFDSRLLTDDLAEGLIDSAVASYLEPYWEATGDRLRSVQAWYLHTFLPWLLMDNDRCSMAHSIEGRFPFLAKEVVALALQLPAEWNIPHDSMHEKALLRRAAADRLPVEVWRDRVKSPLPIPNAVSYPAKIVERLLIEIEEADKEVWEVLDKRLLLSMIREFKQRMEAMGSESGESLTSYVALDDKPPVRTAELFAVLTFLRWYELFFGSVRKVTSCQRLEEHNLKSTIDSRFPIAG